MENQLRAGPATEKACPTLADDLLRGADAIAVFVFGDASARRKVYYYAGEAKVRMPTFSVYSSTTALPSWMRMTILYR